MLELQKLRYFVAVAETLNVGKAALRLHISQSPLSRQIIALEARLQTELFIRERKRLRLTESGRQLLHDAKSLLEHARQLEYRIKDEAAGRGGSLTIGFVEGAVHAGVLQAALKRFTALAPLARVELKNLRSKQQWEALRFGEIDVGFAHSAPPQGDALVAELVAEERFVLAVPSSHPLARGRIDANKLDGEAFIALPEKDAPEARQLWMAACASAGFAPDIRLEAAEPSVVLGLVDAGFGLAIVQESLSRGRGNGVVFRPLPLPFSMTMQVFRITPRHPRPVVLTFLGKQQA